MEKASNPYRPLGRELKALRIKSKESMADAAEAVEIDVSQLAHYELGQKRPSQQILLLLISHFSVDEKKAIRLWELAGYSMLRIIAAKDSTELLSEKDGDEPKIMFTDRVDILVNNFGVVMSFKQTTSGKSRPVSVAKVGMSREHAKSVLQILQATLSQTENPTFKLPGESTNGPNPNSIA